MLNIKRHDVINSIADRINASTYLEIGVSRGITFDRVKIKAKTAVDPRFRFDFIGKSSGNTSYYQLSSDEFFGFHAGNSIYDIIYLDGLHTFEQTLRDLLNSMHYLSPRGVIVIDDTVPSSFFASLNSQKLASDLRKAVGEPDKSWMGDVYKVVAFIHGFLSCYSYGTVKENHGQTILWKARRPYKDSFSLSMLDISNMSYAGFLQHHDEFMNYQDLSDVLEEISKRSIE